MRISGGRGAIAALVLAAVALTAPPISGRRAPGIEPQRRPIAPPQESVLPMPGAPPFAVDTALAPPPRFADDETGTTLRFRADMTEVERVDDAFIKRYWGNVRVQMNPEVWLTADEAVYSAPEHEIRVRGNVFGTDSGRALRADRITYLLRGHPLGSGRAVLQLRGNVAAEDSIRVLRARAADYWPDSDSIVGRGSVDLRQKGSVLRGDTVSYAKETGNVRATGSVTLADSAEDVTISADRYFYQRSDSLALVSGSPVLTKGRGDTAIVVAAGRMRLEQKTDRAAAWDSVRITRGNLSATCDSVIFDDRENRLVLYGSPRAIQQTDTDSATTVSEAVGERIVLDLDGTHVRLITIENAARAVATEFDTTGTERGERWIAGERIVFAVADERVDRIEAHGQARSRYVPPPSARKSEGMSEASGDTMVIAFENGRMRHVVLRGGVQGIFWPPADDEPPDAGTPEPGDTENPPAAGARREAAARERIGG